MLPNDYPQQIKAYQQHMEQTLRDPDGWLTLVGLHWLKEGSNTIGAYPGSDVPLPTDAAPDYVGELIRSGEKAILMLHNGVAATLEGKKISGEIELESDINRNPSVVKLGDLSFFIILRGERIGVRVKHANNPDRLNFTGRVWWPLDVSCRVSTKVTTLDPPKPVQIPDVLGNLNDSTMDSTLDFEIKGQTFRLDAQEIPGEKFYIIFHDLSCGKGSYPAGRFLVSEAREQNKVVLDFNKAYNPPCAFTDFATCPLPPAQNYLKVAIEAGERYQAREKTGIGMT